MMMAMVTQQARCQEPSASTCWHVDAVVFCILWNSKQ